MAQLNDPKRNDAIIRSSPGFFLEWLLPLTFSLLAKAVVV